MREGLIVLPRTVDAQHHGTLAAKLVDAFGGFTAVDARGAWRDPEDGKLYDEQVTQYIVGYEQSVSNDFKLDMIAKWVLEGTEERAVYLRYADGKVSIVHR